MPRIIEFRKDLPRIGSGKINKKVDTDNVVTRTDSVLHPKPVKEEPIVQQPIEKQKPTPKQVRPKSFGV